MKIPFFDLKLQNAALKDELDGALHDVVGSGAFIMGPPVAALESSVAQLLSVNSRLDSPQKAVLVGGR